MRAIRPSSRSRCVLQDATRPRHDRLRHQRGTRAARRDGGEHDETETGHEEVYVVLEAPGRSRSRARTSPCAGDYLRVDAAATRQVSGGPGAAFHRRRRAAEGGLRRARVAVSAPDTHVPQAAPRPPRRAARHAADARRALDARAQRFALEAALGAGCPLVLCDAVPVGPNSAAAVLRMRGGPTPTPRCARPPVRRARSACRSTS